MRLEEANICASPFIQDEKGARTFETWKLDSDSERRSREMDEG